MDEETLETARRERVERLAAEPSFDNLWGAIASFQGCVFHTAKGLEFSYVIKGGEMKVNRKEKTVTRSSVERAYLRALKGGVTGPKKLGVFGASYLYPVFERLGLL